MGCSASINLGREHWHSNQRCIREEAVGYLLSLIKKPGLVVLLCQLLLPCILPVLRWVPLLEEGGEPHCVITGMNSLHTAIQSSIAGEEIRIGSFYWIDGGTFLS